MSDEKPPNLVLLRPNREAAGALTDLPGSLRKFAEDVAVLVEEAKKTYGDDLIARAVCVVRISGQDPGVYAFGHVSDAPQAYMDLHAGATQLMGMSHPGRAS